MWHAHHIIITNELNVLLGENLCEISTTDNHVVAPEMKAITIIDWVMALYEL